MLTQNIDGLHHAAGSSNVIDIHGNIYKIVCPKCMWRTKVKDYSEIEIPPRCPECKGIMRPDVVFFGEVLPYDKCQIMARELDKSFDIYFSIGTTSVFPYIQQPIIDAKSVNRPTIEINPTDTGISNLVDIKLPLRAAEALDKIWRCYEAV